MDNGDKVEFVINFLTPIDFVLGRFLVNLICGVRSNEPPIACQDLVHCIEPIDKQVTEKFLLFSCLVFVLILQLTVLTGAGGVLRPTTCLSLHTVSSSASGLERITIIVIIDSNLRAFVGVKLLILQPPLPASSFRVLTQQENVCRCRARLSAGAVLACPAGAVLALPPVPCSRFRRCHARASAGAMLARPPMQCQRVRRCRARASAGAVPARPPEPCSCVCRCRVRPPLRARRRSEHASAGAMRVRAVAGSSSS